MSLEIINMYDTGRGKECKKHLEKELTNNFDGQITIWRHKSKIVVENQDAFHEIAKGRGIKVINKFGGLHYIAEISDNDWTVCLGEGLRKTFLDKYRANYNIS